ncbi:MAG: ECF transporter S component [Clostridia bacterium]|nr:ECF transporter S component [Clostridia bacterium]
MQKNKSKIAMISVMALLSAVVAVVSFLPLKTMGLEITLSMVPIAVGAILYGPVAGAFLGAVFGIVSFLQCFGYSPFGVMILSESPLFTFIVCVPTRILAGLITGLIAKLMSTGGKALSELKYIVCSLVAPILNTVFFMSALVICFYGGETVQGFVKILGAANPFVFIVLFVGINGLVEIIAGFVVAYPVSRGSAQGLRRYL